MSGSSFHHLRASRKLWWLVVISGLLTLVIGSIGNWQYEHEHSDATHPIHPVSCALTSLYHAVQMLILHTPHFEGRSNLWLETGRWLGAFTLVTTTGMLLWKRSSHELKLFRLASWTGHHVVCGLGRKGLEVVRYMKQDQLDACVVVIDLQPDEHLAEECAEWGVCMITGDATASDVLKLARVAQAGEIIVITPEDETNVRIATQIRRLMPANQTKTPCFVHLEDIDLRERLQRLTEGDSAARTGLELHFFDLFDDEARRVLLELPLDGTGIDRNDPRTVHVVIVGFGRMGRSLALRAAKLGHFANGKKLRISVIDRHAAQARERFLGHYPLLEKDTICRLTFHQAEAQSLTARRWIEGWAAEPDTLLHLFVCLDDNAQAVETGLRLQEALAGRPDCSLRLRIKSRASMADILELAPTVGPRLAPFGMVEDACCDQAFRHTREDAIARAIHELFVNKRRAGSIRGPENDPALRAWEELREEIRESNRQQADHIALKLRAIGCKLVKASEPGEPIEKFEWKEIELLAPVEHKRWSAERWLAGWRYGTPTNKLQRINENLVDWDALDPSVRKYDEEAVEDIPTIVKLADPPQKVVRVRPSGA